VFRFFRTLRQRLLTENRVSKYLLYAVGEILLVVIGILIALQVDDWREERRLGEERIAILTNLKTDLINDIDNYHTNIRRLEERQEIANQVLELFEQNPSKIDSADTARKLLILGYIEDYSPSFATYNEIQGSGKLGLLNSNELKIDLANFRSAVDYFRIIENNWSEDLKDYERIISGYFEGNIPLQNYDFTNHQAQQNKNLRFDLMAMSQSEDLISRIRHIAYFTKMQIDIKKVVLLPMCEGTISKIEAELKN